MNDSEVIANQARKIEALEAEVKELARRNGKARGILTCIGGPINDNRLKYSKEQVRELLLIDQALKGQD